jgi:hypothetical protein
MFNKNTQLSFVLKLIVKKKCNVKQFYFIISFFYTQGNTCMKKVYQIDEKRQKRYGAFGLNFIDLFLKANILELSLILS